MIHLGIDHHKKYSHVVAMTDSGEILWDGQVTTDRESFASIKAALPKNEPVQSVLEAGRNWGILYDTLEELDLGPHLANPFKTRLIAESFVKTDKIDATVHALLLRAGMSPMVHVPSRDVRTQRYLLRRRLYLVKMQTALKNRIHNILDRNHFKTSDYTDLFGSHGRAWMNALALPEVDAKLLKGDLALLDTLRGHIRETEAWIRETLRDNALIPWLKSLPGVGETLAALIALEVDTIDRFASPEKFCSYSGLANSTYSSGGKTRHGGFIPSCNHYLRFAFIEASWVAIRVSPYFKGFYTRLRSRKGVHDAIGATARKLCEMTYHCLKQKRVYREQPYRFKPGRLRLNIA